MGTVAYIKEEKVVRKIFPSIEIKILDNNSIITIHDAQKKGIKKKLVKYIIKHEIEILVFSKELDGEFKEEIIESLLLQGKGNIQLATGKKLMEYMEMDLLEYILKQQGTNKKQEEIYILFRKDEKINLDFLQSFIESFRMTNIVTNDIKHMKLFQEQLLEKENVLISVSNNKRKALKRAKYILNVNLTKQELNKYQINRNAIVINIRENVKQDAPSFDGININYFAISCPDEYMEKFEQIGSNFDLAQLYESVLLQDNVTKRKQEDVYERIKHDEVKITHLIGNNGGIFTEELQKIQKRNLDKMRKLV